MTGVRKKRAPVVLRWLAALRRADDLPDEYPGRVAVVAVAAVLVGYASADGSSCHPAIETIMREAGVSRRTARLVLGWMAGRDWLAVTAKAKPRRPATYRLTFPKGAEEHPWDDGSGVPRSTPSHDPKGAPKGAAKGAEEHPDLLPPTLREEEEEGAVAPLPGGRVAAPHPTALLDLFGDDPAPVAAPRPEGDGLVESVAAIARDIGRHAQVSFDPKRIEAGVEKAKAATGWADLTIAVYCVDTLKRLGRKVRDPAAFLATDLTRVTRDTVTSPRMDLAELLAELYDLDEQADARGLDFIPIAYAEDHAKGDGPPDEEAKNDGLPLDSEGGLLDVWDVKPADLDGYMRLVREAIWESKRRLKEHP